MQFTVRLNHVPSEKRHSGLLVAASVLALMSGCATQLPQSSPTATVAPVPRSDTPEQLALRTAAAQQDRLYRIAAPLLVSNPDLCKPYARNLLGFTAKNRHSYPAELRDAAQSLFGLDDRLQVMGVLPGGGAARAGIQRGDILQTIEDKPVAAGPNAERQAATMLKPMVNGRTTLKMTVVRRGSVVALDVPLTRACAFSIELGNADHVNAYSDGLRVLVTRGMMNFAQSDTELAYVVAKEMAHNSLGHPAKIQVKATAADIIDNLVRVQPDTSVLGGMSGMKAMPQDSDVAADNLSLYLLARAGYSIDGAASFWERLAGQYPTSVMNGYTATHPSTSARLTALEKSTVAVKTKQANRQALLP